MNKISKQLLGSFAAVGLIAAAPVYALPSLTFTDPGNTSEGPTKTLDPVGGFDWISNASAVTTGFIPGANSVSSATTHYLASANDVLRPNGTPFFLQGLVPSYDGTVGTIGNGYEFTIAATIFETATCSADAACSLATFASTGGTFDIYYDSVPDANRALGTGYLDGTKILSGVILPGPAGSFSTASLSGNFTFKADVVFTETDSSKDAYFNPALTDSQSGAEIKIGGATTSWERPSTFVDAGFNTGASLDSPVLVFQADGNTSISAVPEPGSLTLLALGLLGIAGGVKRRKS